MSILLAVVFMMNMFLGDFSNIYADDIQTESSVSKEAIDLSPESESLSNNDLGNYEAVNTEDKIEGNKEEGNSNNGEEAAKSAEHKEALISGESKDKDNEDKKESTKKEDSEDKKEDSKVEESEDKKEDSKTEEKVEELKESIDGKEITVSNTNGFLKDAKLLVVKVPHDVAKDIAKAEGSIKENDNKSDILFAYDIKIVVGEEKYDLPDDESVKVRISNIDSIKKDNSLDILHIKKDLVDNSGNILQNEVDSK